MLQSGLRDSIQLIVMCLASCLLPLSAMEDKEDLHIDFIPAGRTLTACFFTWNLPMEVFGGKASDSCHPVRIQGELSRLDRVAEPFRFDYYPKDEDQVDGRLSFPFQLNRLPSKYHLKLALLDCDGGDLTRLEREIEVPRSKGSDGAQGPLHGVSIKPPENTDSLLTGKIKLSARAYGPGIAEIRFVLDGKLAARSKKSPYQVKINLGRTPRLHHLWAEAIDGGGKLLARDRITINRGPYAFGVRLLDPVAGQTYRGSVYARARLRLPEDKKLKRVDFFVDDRRIVTLFGEPFNASLPFADSELPIPIRVVAQLEDLSKAEDVVLLNAPAEMEGLEVRNVDLYLNVESKRRLPVTGLRKNHFTVKEDGNEMKITEFVPAANLPIHMAFLFDVSGSMERYLPGIRDGANTIIRSEFGSKDRASVMVFQDEPVEILPFSNSKTEIHRALDEAINTADLKKMHGSGIYQSIVTALHNFDGIKGRRALLVFTDGFDNASFFSIKDVTTFARQAEVRLYIFHTPPDQRVLGLETLALDTGGSYYKAAAPKMLPTFFALMAAEVRSQYLIRYQTMREPGDKRCRKIRVLLADENLQVKTINGWCP